MIFLLSSGCCSSLRWKKGKRQTWGRWRGKKRKSKWREVAHMDGMWMTVSGVRAKLELEPMWVWWNVQGTSALWHCCLRCHQHLCHWTFCPNFPHCRPDSSCCNTVINSSHSFSQPFFTYVFTVFSLHFKWYLHSPSVTVDKPSVVNDLTITKQVNSRKSCLE